MSKFIRTQMRDEEGNFVSARINTNTGEIKPYTYRWKPEGPKAYGTMDTEQTRHAHWELVDPPMYGDMEKAYAKKRTGPAKTKHNPNHELILEYYKLSDAKEALLAEYGIDFDNILTGVSQLHTGTRPISQGMLFSMLRDLHEVNTDTVSEYTGHTTDYSRRLAQYMRVLVNAFDSMIDRS